MTTTAGRSTIGVTTRKPLGQRLVRVITTTDHKVIGNLYLATSFAWFLIGGVMAMIMRSELAYPGNQLVNDQLYNQLFTMHGTIMLLLFATPLFFGFANVIMPLQIGSPDVAFPRLNMFSYWLFLWGGLIAAHPGLFRSTADDLDTLLDKGMPPPSTVEYDLADAQAAFTAIEQRNIVGKTVLLVRRPGAVAA